VRIIAGSFKGRKIQIPKNNWPTRPTTDRVRESLFNILAHNYSLEGVQVLDLFAGTGMNSWEFLSRGARHVTLIEKHRDIIKFLHQQSEILGVEQRTSILCKDVYRSLAQLERRFDIIFADPPYNDDRIEDLFVLIKNHQLLSDNGMFILEHAKIRSFESLDFDCTTRTYGDSQISFCTLLYK
jgi:16S rRNA (guanine(966)-N(2))-methyltransferase RsmD